MVVLQGMGVSTSLAVRIFKQYGDASVRVVREEPYRPAAEAWGIGLRTEDPIAAAVGIAHDSTERVEAGLQHVLSEATGQGHCFLPESDLAARAVEMLQVPAVLVGHCLPLLA